MTKKIKNPIYAKNLKPAYERWKKDKPGRNMEDLAAEVGVRDRKSVSQWINGEVTPERANLEKLCDVLGITEEELNGTESISEQFKYDGNFTENLHNGFQQFNAAIGLNEDFLKFIRAAIPDSEFPLWKEVYHPLDPVGVSKYEHREPMEAFYTDKRNYFQLTVEDGRTVNLLYPDFAFLKDIQTEVIQYVEYLYYKRRQEMERELQYFNDKYVTDTGAVGVGRKTIYSLTKYSEYMLREKQKEVIKNNPANTKEK